MATRASAMASSATHVKPAAVPPAEASKKQCTACGGECNRLDSCVTFKQMPVKIPKQVVF